MKPLKTLNLIALLALAGCGGGNLWVSTLDSREIKSAKNSELCSAFANANPVFHTDTPTVRAEVRRRKLDCSWHVEKYGKKESFGGSATGLYGVNPDGTLQGSGPTSTTIYRPYLDGWVGHTYE